MVARRALPVPLALAVVLALASAASPASSRSTDSSSDAARLGEQLGIPRARKSLHSSLVASQWDFVVPESVMQRTFLQQGSTGRIKQVLLKLLMGQTVRIGVVGGSVTVARIDPEHGGYFGRLVEWLKRAFPKANIIARNGAISGTSPVFAEHYLGSLLDPGVDLVMIEYAVNSHYQANTIFYPEIASYERVVRSVLTGQHAHQSGSVKDAAVLMVNMWRCCVWNEKNQTYSIIPFTETIADHYNVLAQYYSVPTVSLRNGLYHAYREGRGLFDDVFREFPPNERHSMTHPNALGYRIVSDLIAYAFYVVLDQLEQHGLTGGDLELIGAPLPPPLVSRHHTLVLSSYQSEALRDIVDAKSKWKAGSEDGKFGIGTTTPGEDLFLILNTTLSAAALERLAQELPGHDIAAGVQVNVELGLLRSYEHMGVLRVRCASGCTCTPATFNTHIAERHSISHTLPVPVSQAERCEVQVTCDQKTTSGEHKLTLRGVAVVVTEEVGPLQKELHDPGYPTSDARRR